MLTAQRLRQVLDYDRKTGIFTRLISTSRRYKPGCLAGTTFRGRIKIQVDGVLYPAHRLAWVHVYGEWPLGDIDHIDRDATNNRINNLRLATRSQNNANSVARSASGFKGVYRERGKWRAQVRCNGRLYRCGTFDTPEMASMAYAKKAKELFGEYARL